MIFDLDGTILNTLEDLADACNWVCAQHGWPEHPLEAYKYFVGNGPVKLLERITPADVEQTKELRAQTMEQFLARYGAHQGDKTAPYPGLPELMVRLKAAGVTLAVLSNKPDSAAGTVVERYYPGLFSAVQGSLPGAPIKPDPTLLRGLMGRIGARPETTLFVGDSNVDVFTAKNAGLKCCGVLWGFRTREELAQAGADHFARDAAELERIILG